MNLLYNYTISPVADAWKRRWPSDEDLHQALHEIPEVFRFFQHCEQHQIRASYIEPSRIQRGDTVLISAPQERCNPSYRESASPQMEAHFEVAESIFDYIRKKAPHGPNFTARSLDPNDPSHRDICRDLEANVMDARVELTPEQTLDWKAGMELANRLEQVGGGYCEDLAHIGKLFAWREYPDSPVELVRILNGRHTFLVIGRDQNSDLRDYRTWGDHCLVCDPWAGKYYPAWAIETELYNYLHDMMDSIPGSSLLYPYVRRFDPKTQSLICEDPVSPDIKQAILAGQDIPASNLYG